jgi:hypothetical protein
MISPSFLLAKESNPALLHILLETITNIVEHQHSQNPILLYAIVHNAPKSQQLQTFDLQKALSDLEERKNPKEDREHNSDPKPPVTQNQITPSTPNAAFTLGDEDDEEEEEQEPKPLSEKPRGKLPEGVQIPRRESNFSIRSNPSLLSPFADRRDFHPGES